MGQIERSTSNPTQHQRQPDVNWNPIVTYGVERRSDVGFDGSIGDGSKADRVCGLRPSCVTPTQPHRRQSATPSSSQRTDVAIVSIGGGAVTVSYPAAGGARTLVLDVCVGPSVMRGCPP